MIREDKSYLSSLDLLAIEKDIAKLDIYSLRINREQYTEEQKEQNKKLADSVSKEEWARHCDEVKRRTANRIEPLIEKLSQKFNIYQYKNNDLEHFRSNWDLFFWCNCNNRERDYSYITLNFNKNRTAEERQNDLNKVLNYLKEIDYNEIDITIQYTATYNNDIIKQIAIDQFIKIQDKVINFRGYTGKIKIVGQNQNGENCYGFFKKGARKKYYQVSNMDLLGMAITA